MTNEERTITVDGSEPTEPKLWHALLKIGKPVPAFVVKALENRLPLHVESMGLDIHIWWIE